MDKSVAKENIYAAANRLSDSGSKFERTVNEPELKADVVKTHGIAPPDTEALIEELINEGALVRISSKQLVTAR